jgi:CTP:molybdopterin cytidylyltransferase MocA
VTPAIRQSPFACIVLAAGAGRRFGGPKAEAILPGGVRFLDAVVSCAIAAGADPVIAVVPSATSVPAAAIGVVNEDALGEQIATVRMGLDRLESTSVTGSLIWPVDHPLVRVESVLAVVDGARRTAAPIVIPTFDGRRGHPPFFGRETWTLLRTVKNGGARAVIRQLESRVLEVPVQDAGVIRDIDTRADLPDDHWRPSDAVS